MKKINNLAVTVKYTVQLSDMKVSDAVHKGLMDNYEFDSNDIGIKKDKDYNEAFEWLAGHINESDATDWVYEIDDID